MSLYDYDMITIGAGSGGVAASRRASSYGARVAICEESRVGGTCVIRGCVPKKLLVYASEYQSTFEDAAGFGWTVGDSFLDWGRLIERKNQEINRLNGIYIRMLRDARVDLLEGRAVVVDAHTVKVGDKQVTAEHLLIATGSRPFLPKIPGIEYAITSNEALDLPKLPGRITIVGGGYIGVEFAGIFSTLGVKVTMVIRGDTVLRGFDDDIRSTLTNEMRKRGIEIRCETLIADIEKRSDGTLNLMTKSGDTLEADAVMYATGRVPNTNGMGLQEAGVQLDDVGAVTVLPNSRSVSVPNIYAVGDCTNRMNLTPVAIAEGRAVVEGLFNNRSMTVDHSHVPSAVFSQPPVGTVGLSEREARHRFGQVDVYVTSFRPMKHTLSGRDERVMMKLVVDEASGKVVGLHMVGADAPEIVQGFALAIRLGATKANFDATVGIHPSAGEEFFTLRDKRPDHIPEPHV